MASYEDIVEARKYKYSKTCSNCQTNIEGYLNGIWNGEIQLRLECSSCGTITEYVDIHNPTVHRALR